jgi:hypothetical protein
LLRLSCCLALVLLHFAPLSAPAADLAQLRTGYDQMYNLRFDEAHKAFSAYEQSHPKDPLGPASTAAAYLFSEFNRLGVLQSQFLTDDRLITSSRPLAEDPSVTRNFEAALARTARLAAAAEKEDPNNADARLAQVLQYGLHANYLALVQKRQLASLREVKQGRQIAELLVAQRPGYEDAYIAMGVENYLLSLKAAPVRWLLRAAGAQTDGEAGVRQLRITAEKGKFLAPYARVLLAVAALRRKDTREAREQLTWLTTHYPGNQLYRNELAKLK